MKTAQTIIDWYAGFDPHQYSGDPVEAVTKARQKLSSYMVGIAQQIERLELVTKQTYHQRKVAEIEAFLSEEGTIAEREAKAYNEELRSQEAQAEGELKGLKTMWESYGKVLDAMASHIRVMTKL